LIVDGIILPLQHCFGGFLLLSLLPLLLLFSRRVRSAARDILFFL
jgi:hypothetical protein